MKFKENSGAMDSKNYLKLKDKESATGIFVGDFYEYRQHWVTNRSELCSEDNLCPHCAQGLKSSFRFRINFITKDKDGNYQALVFEQGWTVYNAMRELHSEYDLTKHIVKITRSGSGKSDTSYSILPIKNGAVTPELGNRLCGLTLQDLKHKNDAERLDLPSGNSAPPPAFDSEESLPF